MGNRTALKTVHLCMQKNLCYIFLERHLNVLYNTHSKNEILRHKENVFM